MKSCSKFFLLPYNFRIYYLFFKLTKMKTPKNEQSNTLENLARGASAGVETQF